MKTRSTFNINQTIIATTIVCAAVILVAETNATTFSDANDMDSTASVERPHPTPRPRPTPHPRPPTITVNNTNDNGPGSLRQALADAHDGYTIIFSVTGTIGLTSGELFVEKNIGISGPGSDVLAIDANGKSRVFHIMPDKNVTISHLAIRNGRASGVFPDDSGAGIYIDHAIATIDGCTITGNSADGSGGAIYNDGAAGSAALRVSNTMINANSANLIGNGDGGGVFNDGQNHGTATVVIADSTVSGNSAAGFGGGIASYGNNFGNVSLLIAMCTFTANSAQYNGGGIVTAGEDGGIALLQINDTTLDGNLAQESGAGILNAGDFSGTAHLQITNCTLSGNLAQMFAGGIYNAGEGGNATLNLAYSTLSGNSAGNNGGALYNDGQQFGNAAVELGNTVLNTGVSGANIFNNDGTVTSLGYSLSSDDGGSYLTGPGDQINTDPQLGPLQDNGGPTSTHALLPGSPAIDAGDPSFIPPPSYDQRGPGFDRVVNGRIDIGSFEAQGPIRTLNLGSTRLQQKAPLRDGETKELPQTSFAEGGRQ